jgi:hypothetical protein
VTALRLKDEAAESDAVHTAFEAFDVNLDGVVSFEELKAVKLSPAAHAAPPLTAPAARFVPSQALFLGVGLAVGPGLSAGRRARSD